MIHQNIKDFCDGTVAPLLGDQQEDIATPQKNGYEDKTTFMIDTFYVSMTYFQKICKNRLSWSVIDSVSNDKIVAMRVISNDDKERLPRIVFLAAPLFCPSRAYDLLPIDHFAHVNTDLLLFWVRCYVVLLPMNDIIVY